MSKRRLVSVLMASIAAALGAFAATGPANGAIYLGSFHPRFSLDPTNPLYDLGYSGTGLFDVGNCVPVGPFSGTIEITSSQCAMSFISAQVTLFDFDTPSIVQNLSFLPPAVPSDPGLNIFVTYNSTTSSSEVVAIDTGLYLSDTLANLIYQGPLWLQFGHVAVPTPSSLLAQSGTFVGQAVLFPGICESVDENHDDEHENENGDEHENDHEFKLVGSECAPDLNNPSNPATVSFTLLGPTIPEPGSVALVGAALAVGWFVRRRVREA